MYLFAHHIPRRGAGGMQAFGDPTPFSFIGRSLWLPTWASAFRQQMRKRERRNGGFMGPHILQLQWSDGQLLCERGWEWCPLFAPDGKRNGRGRTSQFLSHVASRTWDYFSRKKKTRETGKASGRGEGTEVKWSFFPVSGRERGKKEGRQAWTPKLVNRFWSIASLDIHLYSEWESKVVLI